MYFHYIKIQIDENEFNRPAFLKDELIFIKLGYFLIHHSICCGNFEYKYLNIIFQPYFYKRLKFTLKGKEKL